MTKVPMGPPPPKNPNPPPPDDTAQQPQPQSPPQQQQQQQQQQEDEHPQSNQTTDTNVIPGPDKTPSEENPNPNPTSLETPEAAASAAAVPYTIPPWSDRPSHPFSLEVLKDGSIMDQLDISGKGAYMFGRIDLCDFVLEHPTISRFHAVLQFKRNGDAFLYDLGSTHGTFVNKSQVKKKVYTELHVGDVIRFGHSSRLYIFQGPTELMPPESDLTKLRNVKVREEMQDREASLLRARVEASLVDGISWGMAEDAIEEATEEDANEITWQTYQGQLTEKQEKTRAKILKRTEKVSNMKKEIDAIRAKDIAQGGLTQGQQTQIARNEQRISQIMEELESLEETLNESIQESLGARSGKSIYGKNKGTAEDEDVSMSDDDEFYDRTKKKPASKKNGEQQSIETADTLLDKKEAIIKEMEEKNNLLLKEKTKMVPEIAGGSEGGDALDEYMTGLSSQLVFNATARLQEELSALQSEFDRIQYLLKIADPTGEAAGRRGSKAQISKSNQPDVPVSNVTKRLSVEQKKSSALAKPANCSSHKDKSLTVEISKSPEGDKDVSDGIESKVATYTVTKPIWLGATGDMEVKENQHDEASQKEHESKDFVDYKDRKKALAVADDTKETVERMIEDAAPGLIVRKRKQMEKPRASDDKVPEVSTSSSSSAAENTAADAVALLLKHKRGYFAVDGEERNENQDNRGGSKSRKEKPVSKRVLGPERPAFLDSSPESETWVPPKGQLGDGRTSLNDRYGY